MKENVIICRRNNFTRNRKKVPQAVDIQNWNYEYNKKLVALQLLKSKDIKKLTNSQIYIIHKIVEKPSNFYLDRVDYYLKHKKLDLKFGFWFLMGMLYNSNEYILYNKLDNL
jgi:hypothetical protein